MKTRRTGMAAADLFAELCDLWGYHNIVGSELRLGTVRVAVTVETNGMLERHEHDFTDQTTYQEALEWFASLATYDERNLKSALFRFCPPEVSPGWTPETSVTIRDHRDPFLPTATVVEDDGEMQ